jgi:hypothetical protein
MRKEQIVNKTGLGKVDRDMARRVTVPIVMGTQKQLNLTHKINPEVGLKGGFKPEFHGITNAKVAHVIHIDRHI